MKTGEYFVFIENRGTDRGLFIGPGATIDALELRFFNTHERGDERTFLKRGAITMAQARCYRQTLYSLKKMDEMINKGKYLQVLDMMTEKEIRAFLETLPPEMREALAGSMNVETKGGAQSRTTVGSTKE